MRLLGLVVGLSLFVTACAASKAPSASPAAASPADLPPAPRTEIDRLSAEIDAAATNAGLEVAPPACAAGGTCTAAPMAAPAIANDPTCKPGPSETCSQSCTLASSICDNAGRICQIAKDLGGADAYANEKCERGNSVCAQSRERCCGCT